MNFNEIVKIVNGVLINTIKPNIKVQNIKIDSRTIEKKDLFICIKGKNFNGHDYIKDAIKNGAKAIITEDNLNYKVNVPVIKVESTIHALENLAKYQRNNYNGIVIGITGSVGKTTTKELLTSILREKYKVVSNIGNHNNLLGLAITLFNLKENTEVLITELGMNHKGEINRLSKIVKPHIGIITKIGTSHIGNLKSQKNIFKAKLEIINGMNKGNLIINGDDKYLNTIKPLKELKIIKCGQNKTNDFFCLNVKPYFNRTEFDIKLDNQITHFIFNIPGLHLLTNILIVIKTSLLFGIDMELIKEKVSSYRPYDRRMKTYNYPLLKLIDDSYNSSYESLKGSIEVLNKFENKLLIVGDILELGKYSRKIHKKIGKLLKIPNAKILIIGKEMEILKKKYKHFKTNKELINYLEMLNLNNYTVLVKGSNILKLNEICTYLQKRFDINY